MCVYGCKIVSGAREHGILEIFNQVIGFVVAAVLGDFAPWRWEHFPFQVNDPQRPNVLRSSHFNRRKSHGNGRASEHTWHSHMHSENHCVRCIYVRYIIVMGIVDMNDMSKSEWA